MTKIMIEQLEARKTDIEREIAHRRIVIGCGDCEHWFTDKCSYHRTNLCRSLSSEPCDDLNLKPYVSDMIDQMEKHIEDIDSQIVAIKLMQQ